MQTLRNARWITRLVLVWFALFIGAAIASPMVKPASGQMVCSAMGGMKMVMDADSDQGTPPSANMDCPLCAPVITPPVSQNATVLAPQALAHALRTIPAAHIAGLMPEKNFIGVEVHTPGIGSLLKLIGERDIQNLRLFQSLSCRDNVLVGLHRQARLPWPDARREGEKAFP